MKVIIHTGAKTIIPIILSPDKCASTSWGDLCKDIVENILTAVDPKLMLHILTEVNPEVRPTHYLMRFGGGKALLGHVIWASADIIPLLSGYIDVNMILIPRVSGKLRRLAQPHLPVQPAGVPFPAALHVDLCTSAVSSTQPPLPYYNQDQMSVLYLTESRRFPGCVDTFEIVAGDGQNNALPARVTQASSAAATATAAITLINSTETNTAARKKQNAASKGQTAHTKKKVNSSKKVEEGTSKSVHQEGSKKSVTKAAKGGATNSAAKKTSPPKESAAAGSKLPPNKSTTVGVLKAKTANESSSSSSKTDFPSIPKVISSKNTTKITAKKGKATTTTTTTTTKDDSAAKNPSATEEAGREEKEKDAASKKTEDSTKSSSGKKAMGSSKKDESSKSDSAKKSSAPEENKSANKKATTAGSETTEVSKKRKSSTGDKKEDASKSPSKKKAKASKGDEPTPAKEEAHVNMWEESSYSKADSVSIPKVISSKKAFKKTPMKDGGKGNAAKDCVKSPADAAASSAVKGLGDVRSPSAAVDNDTNRLYSDFWAESNAAGEEKTPSEESADSTNSSSGKKTNGSTSKKEAVKSSEGKSAKKPLVSEGEVPSKEADAGGRSPDQIGLCRSHAEVFKTKRKASTDATSSDAPKSINRKEVKASKADEVSPSKVTFAADVKKTDGSKKADLVKKKTQKSPVKKSKGNVQKRKQQKQKLVHCGVCNGCKSAPCRKCSTCTANPKRRCKKRPCTNPRFVPMAEYEAMIGLV